MKSLLTASLTFFCLLAIADPKKPNIYGQYDLATDEETAFTIRLSHLKVYDADDYFYPWGFTLKVYEGANYTLSGHVVTPARDFNGVLIIKVQVNDGKHDSNIYDLLLTVRPVNDRPVITGQQNITTIENTPVTIQFAHLSVTDPDDDYPQGFTLFVYAGSNYTASGTTVTPKTDFIGTLTVPVAVSDGKANSTNFNLQIEVESGNKRPVIKGQLPLSTAKNSAITISLTHLTVEDPDNKYPDDFTLEVYAGGGNYTVSGKTVTPANNFTGTLQVPVTVNDGNRNSERFNLRIDVTEELQITGQKDVTINEDETLTLDWSHIEVYDPAGQFPNGHKLTINPGENYTARDLTITPKADFNGVLVVNLTVSNPSFTSKPYAFRITITPVNDPPVLTGLSRDPVRYNVGYEPARIMPNILVEDVDDEHLIYAEVSIMQDYFQAENDILTVTSSATITTVYDRQTGILSLVGQATLKEYSDVLKSVYYSFVSTTEEISGNKIIQIRLSDGKDMSITYQRDVVVNDEIELDIPTVFTPNEDSANDTWRIKALRPSERFKTAQLRVYDRRGRMVHEAMGLDREWDGRMNGQLLPADSYFYVIDFTRSNSTKSVKGVVTILR